KTVLQLTSTTVTTEGLFSQGAGQVNVVAAAQFGANRAARNQSIETNISGEVVSPTGIAFGFIASKAYAGGIVTNQSRELTSYSVGRGTHRQSLVWGVRASTLVWGCTLVWGASADTLVWGAADTLVWGASSDTLVWGAGADTLVWGASSDTLVWGAS